LLLGQPTGQSCIAGYDADPECNEDVCEIFHIIRECRSHPPLGAWAEVNYGVEVVTTGSHGNRVAPSGWMMHLVRLYLFSLTLDSV